jgi:hypothetical protein
MYGINVKGNGTLCLTIVEENGRYATLSMPCEASLGGKPVVELSCKMSDLEIKGGLPPLMAMTQLKFLRLGSIVRVTFLFNASRIVYRP